MALGQYSTDYFRSVYHRIFSVKYSDFCILVILVSLQASCRPVIIKQTDIPSMVALPKTNTFLRKKKLLDTPTFRHDCLSVHQITGQKNELPGGYCQKCTSAEKNLHPPELAYLCQTVHMRPPGDGDICTYLVRMLHFISQYILTLEPKVTSTFLSVLFP